MKLLTAIVTAAIVLVPPVAQASPTFTREVIVDTFCSYSLLRIENAVEDCVELAFEADSRGYDVPAIKRNTDRFTARVVGMDVTVVSTYTSSRIQEWVRRNR